jgi:hypothetical protein
MHRWVAATYAQVADRAVCSLVLPDRRFRIWFRLPQHDFGERRDFWLVGRHSSKKMKPVTFIFIFDWFMFDLRGQLAHFQYHMCMLLSVFRGSITWPCKITFLVPVQPRWRGVTRLPRLELLPYPRRRLAWVKLLANIRTKILKKGGLMLTWIKPVLFVCSTPTDPGEPA